MTASLLKMRKRKFSKSDARYSRNLLRCWCIAGNCKHYDRRLCNLKYNDSINSVRRKIQKKIEEIFKEKLDRRNFEWLGENFDKVPEDI